MKLGKVSEPNAWIILFGKKLDHSLNFDIKNNDWFLSNIIYIENYNGQAKSKQFLFLK